MSAVKCLVLVPKTSIELTFFGQCFKSRNGTMAVEQDIQQWVAKQLQVSLGDMQWLPLSGDASFRRYFRCVLPNRSFMVALAPPATEKNHEFVTVSAMLSAAGVLVSQVIAVDYEHGYLLQNDFGDSLLWQQLTPSSVDSLYAKAMQQLQQMLAVDADSLAQLSPYSAEALSLELSYFKTWFLEAMLQYICTPNEEQMLQVFFDELIASALSQPQVFVHRDYHCRNIMITADNQLATIDFQDALRGAITYDLVSLLRDCYVVWPEQRVRAWVKSYWQILVEQKRVDVDESVFQRWFDLMGLQRHIKVLGIFARLSLRDGKHGYLNDLPTVFRYVQSVAAQHEVSKDFLGWLNDKIKPLAQQQVWGKDL
jgi:hypothetical protein